MYKSSRTYRDSLDNDVEILRSTQGSGVPVTLHSAALSRPTKRAAVESSARRQRYNYRVNSNTYDGDKEFFASFLSYNYDKDLSDVKYVENLEKNGWDSKIRLKAS